jgi:hypothetical protein
MDVDEVQCWHRAAVLRCCCFLEKRWHHAIVIASAFVNRGRLSCHSLSFDILSVSRHTSHVTRHTSHCALHKLGIPVGTVGYVHPRPTTNTYVSPLTERWGINNGERIPKGVGSTFITTPKKRCHSNYQSPPYPGSHSYYR